MSTMTFDTHRAVKRLIGKGINQAHAEAIVEAMQESREVDFSQLVTKDYFENRLDAKLNKLRYEMVIWLIGSTATIIGVLKLL